MARQPVILNVYNMYWLNEYTSNIGLGVYHSGIEVYEKEYAFGGHPFDFTGIFDMLPKDVEDLGEGFTFKETITLGYTDFTETEIKKLVDNLGEDYPGSTYHLYKKSSFLAMDVVLFVVLILLFSNCNHFTNEFAKLLCGKSIPNWVNRLATICIRFPFIAACIPKEWLTPDGGQEFDSLVDLSEWEQIEYPKEEEFSISNSGVTKSRKETTSGNGFFKVRTLNNEKTTKTESNSFELGNSSKVSDSG